MEQAYRHDHRLILSNLDLTRTEVRDERSLA